MPDDSHTLTDLARLAGVTPRTVRYYVAQGLLPAPVTAGPATRYGAGHLARLRLIRRLQREHLPLAEIRARLERLGDEEVGQALRAPDPDAGAPAEHHSASEALAFVRSLMSRSGVSPVVHGTPVGPGAAPEAAIPPAQPARRLRLAPEGTGAVTASAAEPRAAGGRSTWERLSITPDVEIHVRRPLDRQDNRRVEQLLRVARDLFSEGS